MKAKNISGQAPGGIRTRLAEKLPLETPFVVQIFPTYACNFKCQYCIFSIPPSKRGFISDKVMMDLSLYKKCVDDMRNFKNKIKVLRFVGIGEPLLHRQISDMIKYTVDSDIADTVEILTNASLLKSAFSDSLIDAGLTRMVVSIQGTSKEKYREVCGANIDFEEFVGNLRYFYENKKDVQVYIKVVDTALDGPEDEKRFYKVFGDLCDTIAIEHTVPIHRGIDYENLLKGGEGQLTQFGLPADSVSICPQPFFTMQINPDGNVVPCYSFEYPRIVGDCSKQSVTEIWKGEAFQGLRRKMLDGAENVSEVCTDCNIIKYRLFPEDDLRNDAARLKSFY